MSVYYFDLVCRVGRVREKSQRRACTGERKSRCVDYDEIMGFDFSFAVSRKGKSGVLLVTQPNCLFDLLTRTCVESRVSCMEPQF
jgi:hypothetical protein